MGDELGGTTDIDRLLVYSGLSCINFYPDRERLSFLGRLVEIEY